MTFTIDIMIKGENSGLYTPPHYYRCSNECFREFCKLEFPIMGFTSIHGDCQKESLYDNFDEDQKRRFDEGYNDIGLVNLWYYIKGLPRPVVMCDDIINYFTDLGDFIRDILDGEDDGANYYIVIS